MRSTGLNTMSSVMSNLLRREIIERSTTTIIHKSSVVTAATGVETSDAGAGPAVGKRWLIVSVGATAKLSGGSAAGDRGSGRAQIVDGAVVHNILGAETEFDFGIAIVAAGVGTGIILENPMLFRAIADARGSSVGVQCNATFSGFELDEI